MECESGAISNDMGSGEPAEIAIPVIEVQPEVLTAINSMIQSNQPTCLINNVTVQNGLTTNQVSACSCRLLLKLACQYSFPLPHLSFLRFEEWQCGYVVTDQ